MSKMGRYRDYVLRTRLALREAKFLENEELIWLKPDAPPLGSTNRPRRTWEQILWFSTCKNPFVDLKAQGRISRNLGFGRTAKNKEHHADLFRGVTNGRSFGISRVNDVFTAYIAANSKSTEHPAAFPPSLVEQLINTFTQPGDTILDPFSGSGTTLLVARFMKRHAVGIELKKEYYAEIKERIRNIKWNEAPDIPNREDMRLMLEPAASIGVQINSRFANAILEDKQRWKVLDGVKG